MSAERKNESVYVLINKSEAISICVKRICEDIVNRILSAAILDSKQVSTKGDESRLNGSLMSFEKLDGMSNYYNRKSSMEVYLLHEDLWDTIKPGVQADGIATTVNSTKDVKARTKICLMVKSVCLPHIRNAKTAKDAWHNLQNFYEHTGRPEVWV
jgi:hypothetical protein